MDSSRAVMATSSNCRRCGTNILDTEWFCSHCGKERPTCPDCGAEMDSTRCKKCGRARMAPCGNCGLLIEATKHECPECGFHPSEVKSEKARGRKKKAIGLAIGGIVLFMVVSTIVPGPDILGMFAGVLVGAPLVTWGGLIAFYYTRKEDRAERISAADLSKGREQNKSREYREKEAERRAATADAIANVAGAAAEKIEERRESRESNETGGGDTGRDVSSGPEYETVELGRPSGTVLREMRCPNCGQHWRVEKGLRKTSIAGARPMGEFNIGDWAKVQCQVCNQTETIQVTD